MDKPDMGRSLLWFSGYVQELELLFALHPRPDRWAKSTCAGAFQKAQQLVY